MTAKRPLVGITIGYSPKSVEMFQLRDDYVRSVEKAGGLPVVLAPGLPGDAPELLDRLDALVFSGGADVDPSRYGAPPHPKLGRTISERDAFEIALCREALRRETPVLAICRGHQVLNVATGGTLIQDIPSEVAGSGQHDPDVERWERAHEVEVVPGSRLHAILGRDRVAVNSFHHQAVREVGPGLVISARSCGDGVVEGIERPGAAFVVGVQWHPESFWDQPETFQPLFEAVVRAGSRG